MAWGKAPFRLDGPSPRWFKIQAKQNWTYNISALSNFYGGTTVYDNTGTTILAVNRYIGGQAPTYWVAPDDGPYLIKIESTNENPGLLTVYGYSGTFSVPDVVPEVDPSEFSAPLDPLSFSYNIVLGEEDRHDTHAKFLTHPGATYVFEKPREIQYLEVCNVTPFEDTSQYFGKVCRDISWDETRLTMVLPSPYTTIRVAARSLPFSGQVGITGIANDHGSGPHDATQVNPGAPVRGEVSRDIRNTGNARDYFSFHAQAGTENMIKASFDRPDFFGHLQVFPPGSIYDMWTTLSHGDSLAFEAHVTGDYIVIFSGPSVRNNDDPRTDEPYTLTITSKHLNQLGK